MSCFLTVQNSLKYLLNGLNDGFMQGEPSFLVSFIQSVFTLHVLLELKNVTYRKRADPLYTGPDKVNFRFRLAVDGMPTHLVLWPLQAFCFGHLVV